MNDGGSAGVAPVASHMLTFACELTYAETDPGDATQQDKVSRMNHRLVYLLNVGQRRLHRWSQARTGAGGVTAAQAGLLFFLAKNDGALMSEAAAALDLGAPGMSGLVDRAERAGFVQRHADEFDRRASRLWLTEDGRAAGKRSKSGLADLNARLTDGFTASEIDVVARWLASLQEKFPATEEDAAWPREQK